MFDEGVVIHPLIGPEWHGREGFLEMAADWLEDFADHAMQAEDFLDAGEMVVARVRQEGRGIGSGAPSGGLFWFAFTLRGGRVTRFDMYATEADALEAVGLTG
jgi:ketosteroid isomerase-like protein